MLQRADDDRAVSIFRPSPGLKLIVHAACIGCQAGGRCSALEHISDSRAVNEVVLVCPQQQGGREMMLSIGLQPSTLNVLCDVTVEVPGLFVPISYAIPQIHWVLNVAGAACTRWRSVNRGPIMVLTSWRRGVRCIRFIMYK